MDCNLSNEPMDVDMSFNSTNAMEISYNEDKSLIKQENHQPTVHSPKAPKYKKLIVDLHSRQIKSKRYNNLLYALGMMVLSISILVYHFKVNVSCNDNIDTEMLRISLLQRIHGQETAISKIIKTLDSKERIKVLIMFGSTGVGKTLAGTILLRDQQASNIYHYTMPTFADAITSDILLGLTWCKSSYLVVDDLKNNDILKIKTILTILINKSDYLDRNLTIILIYNCIPDDIKFPFQCLSSFESQLRQNLSDINVSKHYVEFNQLDHNILKKCIEYEMGQEIDPNIFEKISKNFDVKQDGCKGVHQKIKYLNNRMRV
ncbi:unnamed protein product [Leptosia nina]|uniref:ATPase AAA-type core domain-containing protein n=1 Tax=Leptosia nina TaxID=320188 RepID=A0AAV1JWN1_9NEOP